MSRESLLKALEDKEIHAEACPDCSADVVFTFRKAIALVKEHLGEESGHPQNMPDISPRIGCHAVTCDLQRDMIAGCSCGHWRDKEGRALRWKDVLRDTTEIEVGDTK